MVSVLLSNPFATSPIVEAAWPKKVYEDDGPFDKLLEFCKEDNDFMLHHGVADPKTGKQYFAVILSVVGDWQWLVKSGKLTRNYNHVVKKAQEIESPQGFVIFV